MTFPEALEELHKGNSVQRNFFDKEHVFFAKNSIGVIEQHEFEYIEEALFNSDDVLATDWKVV